MKIFIFMSLLIIKLTMPISLNEFLEDYNIIDDNYADNRLMVDQHHNHLTRLNHNNNNNVINPIPLKTYVTFNATFYSRQETKNNLPASGVRGSTLSEAERGYGLLQVSVNPKQIPLFSRLNIILWNMTQVAGIALDVGPTSTVDIYVDTIVQAINLGVRSVRLEITAI